VGAFHIEHMRKPKQSSLELAFSTTPSALRRRRHSRKRAQSLRKPVLLDYQTWMQLTQDAADAVEAADRQGKLNF
jgi:hypothetical protein